VALAIFRDSEVMSGTAVFRGTRVPVRTMFDYLEDGETLERFFGRDFPQFLGKLAVQALEEAKELLLTRV
jgi:uncharacterized protein (DUF433 family)